MCKVVIIFSILITVCAYAQQEKIQLSINPKHAEVGQVFNITVTSTVQGAPEIDNIPTAFIQDYSIHQGSTQEMDHNTGIVTTHYFFSYSGMITQAGKYTIGPAFIKKGNKVYQSGKVTVNIGKKIPMRSGSVER